MARIDPPSSHNGSQNTDCSAAPAALVPEQEDVTTTNAQLQAEVGQLREALESRAVIDQAIGVVMTLGSCSSETGWEMLVEISQHSNMKLRTVSAALVARAGRGEPLPDDIQPAASRALGRLLGTAARAGDI